MNKLKRDISPWSLMLTGLGSIIGSGWLFGAWHASAIAGPAAILAWVIGAVVVLAIALTYAEMGAMFPESGGMVRYARYSHGSLVGSVLIALVVYVMLQVAFIGALSPASIAAGWHNLNFDSPLAQLALALNLNWLAMLLYLDAFVSPSGIGSIYTATTARMIYAMEKNNTLPKIFGNLHPLYGVPRQAMWLNLAVSFIFLFFFRGWGVLAAVISVAVVISFLTGPISLMSLRATAPEIHRPLRLKGMGIIAPFAFICASLVLYWARWPLTGQVILLVIGALPIYFYYQAKAGWAGFARELRAAAWLIGYLPAIALVSWLGSEAFGGIGLLPEGLDMVVVSAVAFAFYRLGVGSGYRTPYLSESVIWHGQAPADEPQPSGQRPTLAQ